MAEPSLLGIPVEIRERILRNCMVIGVASARKIAHDHPFDPPFASSQLLRVCSQLYREGEPILYGENIIHYRTGAAMKSFVSKMTAETRSMIKHVGISPGERLNIGVLDTLTSLKTFNIFANRDPYEQNPENYVDYVDRLFARDLSEENRNWNFGMHPNSFIRSLAGRPELVEIGFIATYSAFTSKFNIDERMKTELSGRRLIKFRIIATGLEGDKEFRQERVYSTDGKEGKDYKELLPKTQKHMLNSAGRVVRKDG